MQRAIPCLFMRGGTSHGPFFRASDLPEDVATRDRVLLAVMGSPDARQIDGLGGADSLTSKVGIVSPELKLMPVEVFGNRAGVPPSMPDFARSSGWSTPAASVLNSIVRFR